MVNIWGLTQNKIQRKSRDKHIVGPVWDLYNTFEDKGLEQREGQINLALDISEAIVDRKDLIVEAGVGIGKSLGYLIPSIYTLKYTKRPIVIATSSIQLTEQLAGDIQQASKITKIPVSYVIGKGMRNFACKNRVFKKTNPNDEEIVSNRFSQLKDWVISSESGDRIDAPFNVSNKEWAEVEVKNCLHNSCKFRQECGFFTMRTGMKGTYNKDVIIVNQNLLVEHLFRTSEGYTPLIDLNHEAIIIDEAHNLEEKARNRLTEEWDKKRIQNLIKELRVLVSRRADFDKDLRERLEKTEIELLKMYDDLYVFVTNKAKDDEMHQMTRTNIEFDKYHPDRLLVLLNDFHLNVQLDMGGEGQRQESIMNELNGLITFIQNITNKKDSPLLFWGEIYKHKKGKLIKFCYAPKDIAQQLKNILFNNKTPIVLTSATITQPGENESEQYEYVTNSIGFSGRTTEVKHSPFPYSKNARLFIPENLPAPNSEDKDEYLNQITNSISQLITITEGRTLVLFTAKVDMEYVYHALKEKDLDIKIWRQMEGSSQDEVINNFRKSKGVLLSTGTLWEGIDIPGSDLSSVIITKLPFPVPDPIIQYKVDQSNDRLKDVLIPEMIRDLRQGVGRLIRNENDKGLVSILDSRLSETSNKTYKTEVLNMLPITNQLRDIEEVKNFAEKDLKPLYKECM